ncbi:4-carboxymuconolactone decarboxylase [Candidatus Bathyarchaeota archaeon RBG_13_38_9]|nr:MAG: 4-carboxymuconolactone decarboxylase [Candidatus Bathyarchaeota archaeon RBG_13_38_9]
MFDSRISDYMSEDPLNVFRKLDSEFFRSIENVREFTFADRVLSRKYKLLVAMALDASVGAVEGVRVLAQSAMDAGATKEEIAEVLRVTHYISGVGSTYTAAHALKDII